MQDFLDALELSALLPVLHEHGYSRMQDLRDLKERDLQPLHLRPSHRRRILQEVEHLNRQRIAIVQASLSVLSAVWGLGQFCCWIVTWTAVLLVVGVTAVSLLLVAIGCASQQLRCIVVRAISMIGVLVVLEWRKVRRGESVGVWSAVREGLREAWDRLLLGWDGMSGSKVGEAEFFDVDGDKNVQ